MDERKERNTEKVVQEQREARDRAVAQDIMAAETAQKVAHFAVQEERGKSEQEVNSGALCPSCLVVCCKGKNEPPSLLLDLLSLDQCPHMLGSAPEIGLDSACVKAIYELEKERHRRLLVEDPYQDPHLTQLALVRELFRGDIEVDFLLENWALVMRNSGSMQRRSPSDAELIPTVLATVVAEHLYGYRTFPPDEGGTSQLSAELQEKAAMIESAVPSADVARLFANMSKELCVGPNGSFRPDWRVQLSVPAAAGPLLASVHLQARARILLFKEQQ